MMLIDAVKSACARLAPLGWAALLRRHDLDITRVDLAAELQRELAVDRSVPGFEDFALTGVRGIEPGKPAASLLYHALASPDVHPTRTGEPAAVDAYPTLVELDAIENYVYGLQPPGPAVLAGAVVAVFAYQYRPAASSLPCRGPYATGGRCHHGPTRGAGRTAPVRVPAAQAVPRTRVPPRYQHDARLQGVPP
jgi:hypothetical protein